MIYIKGKKIQSRFELVSKEEHIFSNRKVKNRSQSVQKTKIDCEIKIFAIFMKHVLNSRYAYSYANKLVDDVIVSQFSINFVHKTLWKSHTLTIWESKSCLKSKRLLWYMLIWGHAFTYLSQKKEVNFQNVMCIMFYIIWKRWGDDINSLIYIVISTCSRNVSLKSRTS